MVYHTIIVHLDTGTACASRTELAIRLAREHGSHLIGLAPTGSFEIPIDIASTLLEPGLRGASMSHLRDLAARACAGFDALADAAGLSSFESRIDEANHAASVIAHARGADLVVLGQTDRDAPQGLVERDLPELAVLGCGRPVLVVPFAGNFTRVGHRVLAAWKDSREAVRAFADALPLLQRAQKVTVMTRTAPDVTEAELHDLEAWFTRHGVKAAFSPEGSDLDVGDLLLSRAADLDIDLIVMGCYGRSRLAERLLGGATRSVLEQMTVPVLMSH
jgi:nucleotide-binding universal stress UspA family protein